MQGIFAGYIWAFRYVLKEANILGTRTSNNQYIQVVPGINISVENHRTLNLANPR